MNTKQFNDLLQDVESNAYAVKYDHQIAESIRKVFDDNKDKLTDKQQDKLDWEFQLFRLTTRNSFSNKGTNTNRFRPMATFTDGSIFPDPDAFPQEALEYFKKRSANTTNPILKSRYEDFLWEKSSFENKHSYARSAIKEYLKAIDAYESDEAIIERVDCIQRAAELSIILEKKSNEKFLQEIVVSKLNELIENAVQQSKYRWLIEMFEIVLALPHHFSKEAIKEFIEICNTASDSYRSEGNFHLQRHFLEINISLQKLMGVHNDQIIEIKNEIGESYVEEAQSKSESGIVKAHFLQEAIEHYSIMGNREKVQQLTEEVKASTEQAIENNEFTKFSTTLELTAEEVEKMKTRLGKGKEIPERMGTTATFFPNWSQAVSTTEKHSKEFVFQHLVNTVHYGEKYPIKNPRTKQEQEEDHILTNFGIDAQFKIHFLTTFLIEVIEAEEVSLSDFEEFFAVIKDIDEETYNTILVGLKSFFDGEYLNATYVLTLQLEDFLRHLLRVLGGQTTIPEKGAFREKTLHPILEELRPTLTEPVYRYISWVMEDFRGFNLRNNVAHGFYKTKHQNPLQVVAVIHIFTILVANLGVKEKTS